MKRIRKGDLFYYKQKSTILKKEIKHYTIFPVEDQKKLLENGEYIKASLTTALQLENNLKELYLRKYCKCTMGMHYEIFNLSFNKIVDMCRASEIINIEEYKKIAKLRLLRNEIAHNPYVKDQYIDETKCKAILVPCFEIIKRTFDEVVEIHKTR